MTSASSAIAQTFNFSEDTTLRTIMRDGEPWFVAADVCAVLALGNTTQALSRLDDDESALISIEGRSKGEAKQQRATRVINESGLYSLILSSRKPEAKKFKRWVTSEVLPAIRKTGAYSKPKVEGMQPSDLRNIKRLIFDAASAFRYQKIWEQAIFRYLRKMLGIPAPTPFSTADIPRLALELARVNAMSWQVRDLLEYVEREAVRRMLYRGEEVNVVLAEMKIESDRRMALIAGKIALLPKHLLQSMQEAFEQNERLGYRCLLEEDIGPKEPRWADPHGLTS